MKKVTRFLSNDGHCYDNQEQCINADEQHKNSFIASRVKWLVEKFIEEEGNKIFGYKDVEKGVIREHVVISLLADGKFDKVVSQLKKFRKTALKDYVHEVYNKK